MYRRKGRNHYSLLILPLDAHSCHADNSRNGGCRRKDVLCFISCIVRGFLTLYVKEPKDTAAELRVYVLKREGH